MNLKRSVIAMFTLGVLSFLMIIYFYFLQRDFTLNHREFLLSINKLDDSQEELNNLILRSSIYAYTNLDNIPKYEKSILENLDKLKKSRILQDKNYQKVMIELEELSKVVAKNIKDIDEFLMLNASVKNSLVFLTRYIDDATKLENNNKELFLNAYEILKYFYSTKDTHDMDYMYNRSLLLISDSKDKEIQNFINNFNLHARYLINKFPPFIDITTEIVNNNINLYLDEVRTEFSKIALKDFNALDLFAFVLFGIFLFAFSAIIFLFTKYLKENKKLLKTTRLLEHSLVYDQLTNLHNRHAFIEDIAKLSKPHLLIINVDNFKHINDIYGNKIGNALLKELAKIIQEELGDIEANVYRLGGDEFGVLFEDIDPGKAYNIAMYLENKIALHSFYIENLTLNILVSIASNHIAPILENADLALKHLKKDYTSRVIEYKESLNLTRDIKHNMRIVELIKIAIAQNRIVPYFQAIVDLKESKIVKYEALVRLKFHDGSVLTPGEFLDIAKKTSYYHDITIIMVEKTLEMAKKFPDKRFSINISMMDILDEKLVNEFLEQLKKNRQSASRLDIELLESENLQNVAKVQSFITEVRAFGSKILIDDFGSGYANFSHFSKLDIDLVKIDGSIISGITTDNKKLYMLKSICRFTQGLSLENIAEFVETKEHVAILKDAGVRYVQGYYFSKPLEYPLEYDKVEV